MGAPSWKQYFIYQADYQHWAAQMLPYRELHE